MALPANRRQGNAQAPLRPAADARNYVLERAQHLMLDSRDIIKKARRKGIAGTPKDIMNYLERKLPKQLDSQLLLFPDALGADAGSGKGREGQLFAAFVAIFGSPEKAFKESSKARKSNARAFDALVEMLDGDVLAAIEVARSTYNIPAKDSLGRALYIACRSLGDREAIEFGIANYGLRKIVESTGSGAYVFSYTLRLKAHLAEYIAARPVVLAQLGTPENSGLREDISNMFRFHRENSVRHSYGAALAVSDENTAARTIAVMFSPEEALQAVQARGQAKKDAMLLALLQHVGEPLVENRAADVGGRIEITGP